MSLPSYLRTPKLVTGDGENLSTIVGLGKTQAAPVKLKIARAPEETRLEPPSCEFEYIPVQDFMKGESLSELLEARLAPIVVEVREVAPTRESELFHFIEIGKAEEPLLITLITSAPCEETPRPGGESAEPYNDLIAITKIKSIESETA